MQSTIHFDACTKTRDIVGESPVWDAKTNALYWVDIIGKAIRCWGEHKTDVTSWKTKDFPAALALCHSSVGASNDAIVAFATKVCFFDFTTGNIKDLCVPDTTDGNRLNEAKCDPHGRFWVGSMQNNLNPDGSGREMDQNSGALFCVKENGSVSRHTDHEFGISNTMAWSPDGKVFYFGDSIRNVIFAYDYDKDAGTISNRRVLLENYEYGAPDGSCIDEDGCLWNARFGGSRIIRITPQGKVDLELELPVTNPTSCTFGGADKRTLFVTSAQFSLTEKQLQANPLEGALLAAKVPHTGLSDYKFGTIL